MEAISPEIVVQVLLHGAVLTNFAKGTNGRCYRLLPIRLGESAYPCFGYGYDRLPR